MVDNVALAITGQEQRRPDGPMSVIGGSRLKGPYRWPMSVFIKLVENRPPKEYANEHRADISYDDTVEENSEITYQYDVLSSGALRILR
ncbi:hypothetical protein AB0E67_36480, partial [Streptomyces sp. NPDC032161]